MRLASPSLMRFPGLRRVAPTDPHGPLAVPELPSPAPARRARSLGRVLVPPAVGVAVGAPLGMLLGRLAFPLIAGFDSTYWLWSLIYGGNAGCLAGLLIGVCTLLSRRRWAFRCSAALLGTSLGGLNGAWGGDMASRAGLGAVVGAGAGLVGGLLLSLVMERMQARWSRLGGPGTAWSGVQPGLAGAGGAAPPLPGAGAAKLRAQILRAGRLTLAVRYLLPTVAALGTIGYLAGPTALWIPQTPVALAAIYLPALALSHPTSLLFRWVRRRQLRRRLAELPRDDRARVLLPLCDANLPESVEFVEPLMRDFGLHTEVVPAVAPAGRGDEVTACGEHR